MTRKARQPARLAPRDQSLRSRADRRKAQSTHPPDKRTANAREDQAVTAVVGVILMMGVTVMMAAVATPALLEAADTTREVAEAQAQENRETIRCIEGDVDTCAHGDTRTICWTNQTSVDTQRTECITQPKTEPENHESSES